MKAEFGICISNDDPRNNGRVRAIPISLLSRFVTTAQIKKYITDNDLLAIKNNQYNPWDVFNDNYDNPDPYLCEPLLPKHITVLPKFGQLVKIINYQINGVQNEYIGPYTIDQVTLGEEFKNVIRRLNYSYTSDEVSPKKTKTVLSGFQNEQILLGDDEVIIRLDHINTDKSRKTTYPFLQISKFNDSYIVQKKRETTTENIDFYIDYICELDIEYKPKTTIDQNNITGILYLYNTKSIKTQNNKFGLTKKFYNKSEQYYQNEYIVKHTILTNNIETLKNKVNDILVSYSSKKKIAFFDKSKTDKIQQYLGNNLIIHTDNQFTGNVNNGNSVNDDIIISDLNTWVFRLKPNTQIENYEGKFTYPNLPITDINYIRVKDYNDLSIYISECKNEKRYGKFLINSNKQVVNETTTLASKDQAESATILYSDKILFLSSLNTPNIITNKSYDGLPVDQFSRLFTPLIGTNKTYGMLRGEELLNLIIRLLNIFMNHGHVDGVQKEGSLIQNSKDILSELIRDIKNDINNIQTPSQNTKTINHNFRID